MDFRSEYRIRRDSYCGFEVQRKLWWWPFWHMPRTNTHATALLAEEWAIKQANGVVKSLGKLP